MTYRRRSGSCRCQALAEEGVEQRQVVRETMARVQVCEGGGVDSSGLGEENELVEESVNTVSRRDMMMVDDKELRK